LKADRWLLDQALTNLIENAHRYCSEGAVIEIRGRLIEENSRTYVEFSVSDNGPGIKAEDLPRIFERFYRVDKSRNRALGGTGLGLAIVKHIMLSHGGLARAESQPGQGSKFSLLFPNES
jgi:signal transduction histidine kinase